MHRIWARELEVIDFDDDDDFFSLGGHSLAMAKVQNSIFDEIGVEVSMDELFERATVNRISEHIRSIPPYARVNSELWAILQVSDEQVRAAAPAHAVSHRARRGGLSAAQMIEVYLHGYADRPAVARRRRSVGLDPSTDRRVVRYAASFEAITYGQFHALIDQLRAHWSGHLGIRPGDLIAVLGFTSADYAIVDLACVLSGLVTVHLHSSLTEHQVAPIIEEVNPRVLAVSIESLPTAAAAISRTSTIERVVVFDDVPDADSHRSTIAQARDLLATSAPDVTVTTLADDIAAGKSSPTPPAHAPGDDPVATLIYTSGSTGTPKGAMFPASWIKHYWLHPFGRPDPSVPALHLQNMPMSFLGGRGWLAATLSSGGTAYFCTQSDGATFLDDVALVRPTELVLLPRACETVAQLFENEVARLVASGLDRVAATDAARHMVRTDVLGGRVLTACSGGGTSSSTTRDLLQSCLQVRIVDGYGSTEAGTTVMEDGVVRQPPVVAYRLVDVPESGYTTVDTPHPRGELCIKSPTLFSGYYKRPEDTARVFDADGFYKTGDIMAELAPGRLSYIERVTNVLKLAAVGFVAVSALEGTYSAAPEIDHIYIYGNSAQPFLLAVVVPNHNLAGAYDDVREEISSLVRQIAAQNRLAPHEVPRDFIVEREAFTRENGLLSSSGKPLRPALRARYGNALESLYAEILGREVRTREAEPVRPAWKD